MKFLRKSGIMRVSLAIGELLSGFIAAISLALTFLASGASTFFAYIVSFTFSKPPIYLARKEQIDYKKVISDSFNIIYTHPTILWLTIFFALFNGMVWPTNFLSQSYLQELHVPIIYFGFIFAGMSAIAAIASAYTHVYDKITGSYSFLIMALVTSVSLFILGIAPSIYILPLWAIFNTLTMINHTLVSERVLSIVSQNQAATVLSFQNLARRGIYALFGPLIGYLSDMFSVSFALQIYGVILMVLILPLFLVFKNPLKISHK